MYIFGFVLFAQAISIPSKAEPNDIYQKGSDKAIRVKSWLDPKTQKQLVRFDLCPREKTECNAPLGLNTVYEFDKFVTQLNWEIAQLSLSAAGFVAYETLHTLVTIATTVSTGFTATGVSLTLQAAGTGAALVILEKQFYQGIIAADAEEIKQDKDFYVKNILRYASELETILNKIE